MKYKKKNLDKLQKVHILYKRNRNFIINHEGDHMRLFLIYGPPAVGKLSVAKELQRVTGFKLLHNHLIADAVGALFGYGNPVAKSLNVSLRLKLYQAAAKENIPGLISTFSYYGDRSGKLFLRKCVNMIRHFGGDIMCVRLTCDVETLERCIKSKARSKTKKIQSKKKLKSLLKNDNVCAEIPSSIITSITIDNTKLKPQEVAFRIRSIMGSLKP